LADTAPINIGTAEGWRNEAIPSEPGIYAVYDDKEVLQYIGLSRKVSASVKLHAFDIPQYCGFVRCVAMPTAGKMDLQLAWKQWMLEHLGSATTTGLAGALPPGNVTGNALWSERKKGSTGKGNLRLTDGKGGPVDDAALSVLCRETVDTHAIVCFIKGTRADPDCGFSHRVCAMLDELSLEYETVDTLDEEYNHNIRNVLKGFSDWPTIPQVYYKGELVGGHDILKEMHKSGELKEAMSQ